MKTIRILLNIDWRSNTNKKVIFALIYRFVFMGIAIIGIILNTGIFSVGFKYTSLLYYTIQSNLLAFLLFAFLFFKTLISVIKDKKKARTSFAPQASFMLMVDISLTFLVFWLMLAPGLSGTDYSLSSFHNQAVHTLTPLAVIFDYFLFNPKEELKAKSIAMSLLYPGLYAYFALIFGGFQIIEYPPFTPGLPVSHFPYFFFDFYKEGWMVLVYVLAITAFLILLASVFYFAIKKSIKRKDIELKQ